MGLSLTTADLTRLEAASRLLVSPLAAPSPEAWIREAGAAVRDLVGGESVVLQLSTSATPFLSDDAPDVVGGVLEVVEAVLSDGVRFSDPVTDLWNRLRREREIHTFSWDSNRHLVEAHDVSIDQGLLIDSLRRLGYHDFVGMVELTAEGESMVWVLQRRHGRFPVGEAALPLLGSILPSYRSGLATLGRLGAHRAALDAVSEPLAAFGPDGQELHRNPALVALLAGEPEAARLDAELRRLGAQARWLARSTARQDAPVDAERAVPTARGRYTLRTTVLPPGLFGSDPALLVTVAPPAGPTLPTPETVRERTGLTLREAEVARLLAEGLSNAQVSDRLFIAPATARRHTENVLGKLGIGTRAAVASALLAVA
ncbi:helix-turn-helix transcriptional regulator [Rubrivirga marina]|uniref:HTH luxR-type domain-containing protein n=1 Tax=Rubrivirga marina TaxID=1196024 RepID=A0A271IXI8_9BACT|nr:helix-turn-helix transcriptional regulator [Rubrivirga marina]PAP75971.1 hypothetical protein BSZ37_05710 [Rubrivirga marina]